MGIKAIFNCSLKKTKSCEDKMANAVKNKLSCHMHTVPSRVKHPVTLQKNMHKHIFLAQRVNATHKDVCGVGSLRVAVRLPVGVGGPSEDKAAGDELRDDSGAQASCSSEQSGLAGSFSILAHYFATSSASFPAQKKKNRLGAGWSLEVASGGEKPDAARSNPGS